MLESNVSISYKIRSMMTSYIFHPKMQKSHFLSSKLGKSVVIDDYWLQFLIKHSIKNEQV